MLQKRADFVAITRGARRVGMPAFTIEWRPQPPGTAHPIRLGLTATKKLGGAVVRNRAKRRLRALARQFLPIFLHPGHDVVLVARAACLTCSFTDLQAQLKQALKKAGLLNNMPSDVSSGG
ncbi:MAG: ribonuclease P protein component [Alphaproteobacteria bacterium]|nr:ribonuclease P protein component [Alphaproteobacteria bacterium]NDC56741.1 ribonuclease P protein component [Alphaproteobacteria bacterium]NDG04153.1 ribonuclease P protein component [Alphaproteobacteria bacterium]